MIFSTMSVSTSKDINARLYLGQLINFQIDSSIFLRVLKIKSKYIGLIKKEYLMILLG